MGGPLIFVLVLACIHLLVSGQPSDAQQASLQTQHMITIQWLLEMLLLLKLRQKAVIAFADRSFVFLCCMLYHMHHYLQSG